MYSAEVRIHLYLAHALNTPECDLCQNEKPSPIYNWLCQRKPSKNILGTRGFSRVRREFSVLAEGRHILGRSHHKDLTETGNSARKVSGTHGSKKMAK